MSSTDVFHNRGGEIGFEQYVENLKSYINL